MIPPVVQFDPFLQFIDQNSPMFSNIFFLPQHSPHALSTKTTPATIPVISHTMIQTQVIRLPP